MKSQQVLLGVLAGIAAGALLGILFAPDQGSKTRKKIVRKGEEFSDLVKDKVNHLVDAVSEKFQSVKEESSDIAEQARDIKNKQE